MRHIPSRFRRLDGALADLRVEQPMLLTELDGFLTGVAVSPDTIPSDEWMQSVWGVDAGNGAPFDDPLDVQWFADAVMARLAEIIRDLDRGKPQPIFDVDERNGEVLWELWLDGFADAMALRSDGWAALAAGDDAEATGAIERLSTLIAIANDESALDSVEINAVDADAPAELVRSVLPIYAARARNRGAAPVVPSTGQSIRVGRNDPCLCGSGKKSKRCCG
ncbi:UPF0149 family protein [Sphingomonas sp. R86520]|uniref:UPF0149 family protein n=1 Tax=Sphingomonas sp. R86520 TaxID=3093859 RepID=UPI0036D2E8F1